MDQILILLFIQDISPIESGADSDWWCPNDDLLEERSLEFSLLELIKTILSNKERILLDFVLLISLCAPPRPVLGD